MTLGPPAARRILDEGILAYVAVWTRWGPHVTPVVYVLDGGRLWVTTSRRSVKARRWRVDPAVSGLVRAGDRALSFRGRARTYDVLDPMTWPAATLAGPRLLRAATRFSVKNARFFAGYAVDARKVPFAWTPPGRVFAALAPEEAWIVSGDEVAAGAPAGGRRARYRRAFEALGRTSGLDLAAPAKVRAGLGAEGEGVIALDAADGGGPVVIPARWRRVAAEGAFDAVVPPAFLDVAAAGPDVAAALVLDQASAWRASAMSGLLLQGRADLYAPGETARGARLLEERILRAAAEGSDPRALALVRLRPGRVVWWRGWAGGARSRDAGAGRRGTR